jgi:hypothetical protein
MSACHATGYVCGVFTALSKANMPALIGKGMIKP